MTTALKSITGPGGSNETAAAAAGIEIALWDINAKAAGKPLWAMLGGHGITRVPVYSTDGGWLGFSERPKFLPV